MAAVANVAINVDSRGAVGKLRQVADSSKQVERAVEQMNGGLRRSKREFTSTGNAASQAAGGFSQLVRGLAGAAAGFATVGTAAALAGRAIQSAIGRTESERRLQILASSYGEVAQIQNVAAASAKLFGQSQTETNQSIATAYARLRPLGISLDEISSTYNGFNTAARLSGSTAQEASAAFTQLAQALGSGVLRGDEFNSIAEQAPGLLQAISRELNVAVGELRDYAKDGKITSDVVINALKAIESEGAAPLAEAMNGPEQKLKDLQNETDNLNAEIGKLALPALITVVGELTEVIRTASENTKVFSQVMNGLGKEFEFVLSPLGSFYEYIGGIPGIMATAIDSLFSMLGPLKQVAQLTAFISGETLGPALQRVQAVGSYTGMADAPEDVRRALNTPTRPFRVGDVINESTVAGGKVGGGRSAESIAKEQQRAADAARRQAEAIAKGRLESEQLLDRLKMQLAIEQEINPIKKIQLQNALEQLEITQRYGNLIAEEEDSLRRNNLERAGALELQVANVRQTEDLKQKIEGAGNSMGKFLAEQMKVKKEATELDQAFQDIGNTISSGIIDAISAAVDGTKSLGDVANNVLRDIANTLLRFGLNTLTSGLAGNDGVGFFSKLFGGGRASGGTVRGGTSYLVGERGPELFTPNRSGSIAPNAAMGGSTIVVNVNSSGSQAQGGDQNAKQLGQAIGAAVQAELIKQKRPGGLLAS